MWLETSAHIQSQEVQVQTVAAGHLPLLLLHLLAAAVVVALEIQMELQVLLELSLFLTSAQYVRRLKHLQPHRQLV
jgi:hypothetical protein